MVILTVFRSLLVDDTNVEVTEQFNVTVVATSDIVSIRTPSSAVYSIIDDDCKYSLFQLYTHLTLFILQML